MDCGVHSQLKVFLLLQKQRSKSACRNEYGGTFMFIQAYVYGEIKNLFSNLKLTIIEKYLATAHIKVQKLILEKLFYKAV